MIYFKLSTNKRNRIINFSIKLNKKNDNDFNLPDTHSPTKT